MKKLFSALIITIFIAITSSPSYAINWNEPFLSTNLHSGSPVITLGYGHELGFSYFGGNLTTFDKKADNNGLSKSKTMFWVGHSFNPLPVIGKISMTFTFHKGISDKDLVYDNVEFGKSVMYPITKDVLVGISLTLLTIYSKDAAFGTPKSTTLFSAMKPKIAMGIKLLDL